MSTPDAEPIDRGLVSAAGDESLGAAPPDGQAKHDRLEERFEMRGELGVGGMGRVLLARDRWLARDVALKEPRTPADTARLRLEAAITARLEHPGVLPIYDVGVGPLGQPWFAMRLVRGTSLARLLAAEPTPAGRRRFLRPLLSVCETLAFAHARGMVHRDLKPANLMLGAFGEALVIDWGLAVDLSTPTLPASDNVVVAGTARYMSPEQARAEPPHPADDVFSLGLVLAECLGVDGVIADGTPPELRAIVARATATRAERYPDAKALAADLASYLDGARVSAHRYSATELFGRLVRAWRTPITVAAIAFVVLVVLSIVGVGRIREERDRANESLAMALAGAAERAAFADARGEAEVLAVHSYARHPLPENRGVLTQLPVARPVVAHGAELPCDASDVHEDLVVCRTLTGMIVVHGGVERWRAELTPGTLVALMARGSRVAAVSRIGVSTFDTRDGTRTSGPDLPTFATPHAGGDGVSLTLTTPQVALRLRADGMTRVEGEPCGPRGFSALALHPDGATWAVSCHDGSIALGAFGGSASRRVAAPHFERDRLVTALAFVPNEPDLLLLGTAHGSVLTRNVRSGEVTFVASGEGLVRHIAVDARGRLALVEQDLGAPLVIDVAARAALGRVPGAAGARAVAHGTDGVVVVAGRELARWDFSGVRAATTRFSDGVVTIRGSHDGRHLAVAHGPSLTVLDTDTRQAIGRADWPGWLVKAVAFAPDGASLVAYGFGDRSLVSFSLDAGLPMIARDEVKWSSRRVVQLADRTILRATHAVGVRRHSPGAAQDVEGDLLLDASVLDLVVSADGHHLAALGEDGSLYHWNDRELTAPVPCAREPGARAVAIDDGRALFVAVDDAVVSRCGPDDEPRYAAPGARLTAVAVSKRWVVAGARDGAVWLWRRGDGAIWALAHPHSARVSEVVIGAGERWIASAGWDGRVAFLRSDLDDEILRPEVVEAFWGVRLDELFQRRGDSP